MNTSAKQRKPKLKLFPRIIIRLHKTPLTQTL